MKISELRNKLILRGVIYVLIVGAVIGLYIFLSSIATELDQKHKWLKNDIGSLRGKINNLDAQKVELANAIEIWNGLSSEQKILTGVQITKAEEILTALYQEFFLVNVSTTFSKPDALDVKNMQKETVIVEVSDNNTLSFATYSDRQVYGFIEAFQAQFPGYVKITDLKIIRVEMPSSAVLRQISEGKSPPLVQVSIGFTWYALKELETQDEETGEQKN